MKNRWLTLTVITLTSFLTACASSTDSSNQNLNDEQKVTASSTTANPKDEVICKRVKVKGSNISKRVCKTRAEMDEERKRAADVMEKIRSTTKQNTN